MFHSKASFPFLSVFSALFSLVASKTQEAPYYFDLNDTQNPIAHMKPLYDPWQWHITAEIQPIDDRWPDCTEFPDGWGQELRYHGSEWDAKAPSVFCWANNTSEAAKKDERFYKTTDNCYVASWLVEDKDFPDNTTTGNEFEIKDLPWCGPLRKWQSTNFGWGTWFHETQTPEWQQWMECWVDTNLQAKTIKVDWYYPKVHCWVNGTKVGNGTDNSVWFENAQLLKTGERCYFPQDALGGNFALSNKVGDPMGPCAESEGDE